MKNFQIIIIFIIPLRSVNKKEKKKKINNVPYFYFSKLINQKIFKNSYLLKFNNYFKLIKKFEVFKIDQKKKIFLNLKKVRVSTNRAVIM